MEENKQKISLTEKQSIVFNWFYRYYPIWEKVYYDKEVMGVTLHLKENKDIGKVQLNVFPREEGKKDLTKNIE
jgi:hypothetical protein